MRAAMWWIDRWRQSDAFARMTAEEQGLYRNLCDEVVLRSDGVIPDDPRILAKASGDHEAWARSGASVLKSMKKVRGGWTNETAMKVKNESERRSKKQRDYRNGCNSAGNDYGNASGNSDGNERDNESRPPYQEQEKEKEKTPEIDPGRVVKAESTATPDGTPPINPPGFEPTATAPRRLTPQALGIRVNPANFAQVQLSHDLTALVEVVRKNHARFADPEKFDPVCEALGLLHDISTTPAGKRIETLDLRRVPTAWATVSSHAAYKLSREVYGVDLATARATDTPVAASGSGGEGASASGRAPSPEAPKKPLPALTLTVAPGACPVCSSPLRHSTEGGETVLRCDQETVPCEWAAVWRSCAA